MANRAAKLRYCGALACVLWMGGEIMAADPPAGPTAQMLLRDPKRQPRQGDVPCERPEAADIEKCTLQTEKTGFTVRDANGTTLRTLIDTNGDNTIDTCSFYRDGVEVYREIDSNFNQVYDQYRWLNTGGTRWGVDTNEDGKIDIWKSISAEEATLELVGALKDRDRQRFERLLLSANELKSLGLGKAKNDLVVSLLDGAPGKFATLINQKGPFTPETKWVSFGGTHPFVIPTGTDEATADIVIYENVAAMVETAGKPVPLNVGTLVRAGNAWRLLDAPHLGDENVNEIDNRSVFITPSRGTQADQAAGRPSDRMQELMKAMNALPENDFAKRSNLLEELAKEADTAEHRAQWYRQMADTLSAAVQTNNYTAGIEKLKNLQERLKADGNDDELACYVQFRWMTAEHAQAWSAPDRDFNRIQTQWIEDLEQFLAQAMKFPDSADAMMELAISYELTGDEEKAIKWYTTLANRYRNAQAAPKAAGARYRLDSIGKPMPLAGKTADGKNFDIKANAKGKVVLVQYWATWCQPCKADLPLLKELRSKYGKSGFEVVGVCLDNNKSEMASFLKENNPGWFQLWEEGGLESRYANELGINTLPMMILVDKTGKVVNRNVHAPELEAELQKALK